MKISPMLAETAKEPFDRKDFIYEQKLDGVRCIAILYGHTALQARSGAIITHKFPELGELHKQVRKPCILDGEIVSLSFNGIQHRIHLEKPLAIRVAQTQYPAFYFAFDILYLDGDSVMAKPLIERKAILNSIFAQNYYGRMLGWQTGYGTSLFNNAKEKNLEGIMAKAMYSPYIEGKRSDYWLKVKTFKESVFYICGLTVGENERSSTFGSVILGEQVDGKLLYVGNCGSGFNQEQLRMLLYLLEPMRGECPFDRADVDRPVKFWTRPELKCEVRYLEKGDKLRFPTFRKLCYMAGGKDVSKGI